MQKCKYCNRWFKNYRSVRIHESKCKLKVKGEKDE